MSARIDVHRYLAGPQELRRQELVWGVVREPPAPLCDHQAIVTHVLVMLASYAATHKLGRVLVSPVDVVLDETKSLVVQPDIVFVSRERQDIIGNLIWGAPDLVVEVLSAGTRDHDLTTKRDWYAQYGVREYWTIDSWVRVVQVASFGGKAPARLVARDSIPVTSRVLTGFDQPACAFFPDLD